MVIKDHEVFSSAGRSYWKTSGLISANFSCELYRLQVCHFGLELRLLQRKGCGLHNRWLVDGSGGRIVSGGSDIFSVLVEVTLCDG